MHGGIIDYVRQLEQDESLVNKFEGKNFVFDDRLGERVTDDILASCHLCGTSCDEHTDCNNDACHILFIQCNQCEKKYDGCCSTECKEFSSLPIGKQKELRKHPKRVIKKRYFRSPKI